MTKIKKKGNKNYEQVVASTAGDSSWKAWANRSHGSQEFEVLDLFRGVKRSFQQRFVWGIPPSGTPCPVCFVPPATKSEWHVTSACGHAVCHECLQGYAASLVRDPNHFGPLKCPVCPQHLRPKDAIQALQHDSTLIAQWDAKLRDQLLRALPGYRHCPHCNNTNANTKRDDSSNDDTITKSSKNIQPEKSIETNASENNNPHPQSEQTKTPFLGGGGFVTPECLAPIHKQREQQALEWLEHPIQSQQTAAVLYLLYVYIYSEHHSTSIYVDILNTSLLPAWCFCRLWLLSRKLIAGQARKALFQPIKVECPCCDRAFLLNAESELGNSVLADEATQEWIGSNTRPCPSCSVPISKIDGCNHMSCSFCRAQFCWACMRVNSSKCTAYGCRNGAPYGNADALQQPLLRRGRGHGNNNDNHDNDTNDAGILNRIARLEDEATHVTVVDVGVWISIGIGLVAGESPSVQFLAKALVKSFALIFSVGFMTCLCLLAVLGVMFRDTFYRHQQDVNHGVNNRHGRGQRVQRGQQHIVAADDDGGGGVQDRIQEFIEERMLRDAIQRSLAEQ